MKYQLKSASGNYITSVGTRPAIIYNTKPYSELGLIANLSATRYILSRIKARGAVYMEMHPAKIIIKT